MFLRTRFAPAALAVFVTLSVTPAQAQEPIRFARTPDISPDGRLVVASTRAVNYPATSGLYTVPATGGGVRPLGIPDAKDRSVSPQGDKIAYVRGQGAWYRKGYRGSSSDDIWLCDRDGTHHRRLT